MTWSKHLRNLFRNSSSLRKSTKGEKYRSIDGLLRYFPTCDGIAYSYFKYRDTIPPNTNELSHQQQQWLSLSYEYSLRTRIPLKNDFTWNWQQTWPFLTICSSTSRPPFLILSWSRALLKITRDNQARWCVDVKRWRLELLPLPQISPWWITLCPSQL